MAWAIVNDALVDDDPLVPARYLRSLIFSEGLIDTGPLDEALVYFHRRAALRVIRDYLGGRVGLWRIVPTFVEN